MFSWEREGYEKEVIGKTLFMSLHVLVFLRCQWLGSTIDNHPKPLEAVVITNCNNSLTKYSNYKGNGACF